MPATPYQTTVLPGGVTLATASMPHMESVAVGLWAGVGARHESRDLNGIAHFTEHLLFKGSERRSALQIIRDIERLGASANAYTTEDHTCYHALGPADKLDRLLDVLVDIYRNSTFPEDEIDREREVIEEEIIGYREQPSQHIDDLLSAATWRGNALARPITGTARSIGRLERADFVRFTEDYYGARNTVITLAGKLDHHRVADLLSPLFEGLAPGVSPRRRRFKPPAPGADPRILVETRDVEQTHLSIAFDSGGRSDPDRFALKLMNVVLAENMSSRLWQRLREKTGYCYHVQSDILTLEDTGLWQFYFALEPGKLDFALRAIAGELKRIAKSPPSAAELNRARDYAVAQHRLGLESTSQQMTWTGECLIGAGHVVDPEESRQALGSVTPEAVRDLAARMLRRESMTAVAISKEDISDRLDDFLKKG